MSRFIVLLKAKGIGPPTLQLIANHMSNSHPTQKMIYMLNRLLTFMSVYLLIIS